MFGWFKYQILDNLKLIIGGAGKYQILKKKKKKHNTTPSKAFPNFGAIMLLVKIIVSCSSRSEVRKTCILGN